MTSKQVMLIAAAMLVASATVILVGCAEFRRARPAEPLNAPYDERQVWAVAPLMNESGTRHANGVRLAEQLARQLETAAPLSVVAVNRVLDAMDALGLSMVSSPAEAEKLRQTLGVDALVAGTVTAYDPYDPPKLGLSVELYAGPLPQAGVTLDMRELSRASTDEMSRPELPGSQIGGGPVTVISGYFDAADPRVREQLRTYGTQRGTEAHGTREWRQYRISMDLYSEFVSYQVSWQLLEAEARRLNLSADEQDESAS
ncbi:hypothetical protein ACERK3_12610 [Phycisphaerales bacterium AB-hyl4]|uniref:Uncharacterized protein n=1 Tax=Natronomicrosphaera hydrolytica TaxID=3242702 RepID=A0ABV4U8R3_9BACT